MSTLTLDLNKRYSFADYLTWVDDTRRELIDGFIKLMSPAPARIHQRISWRLTKKINQFVENQPFHVYYAPFDVRLPQHPEQRGNDQIYTVVQPDIVVICDLSKLDAQGCIGAPEMVIEIVSPSSIKHDLEEKFVLYQNSGVLEYWIIFTEDKAIQVFTMNDEKKYQLAGMYAGDSIAKSMIFNGLQVELSDVFMD